MARILPLSLNHRWSLKKTSGTYLKTMLPPGTAPSKIKNETTTVICYRIGITSAAWFQSTKTSILRMQTQRWKGLIEKHGSRDWYYFAVRFVFCRLLYLSVHCLLCVFGVGIVGDFQRPPSLSSIFTPLARLFCELCVLVMYVLRLYNLSAFSVSAW